MLYMSLLLAFLYYVGAYYLTDFIGKDCVVYSFLRAVSQFVIVECGCVHTYKSAQLGDQSDIYSMFHTYV